MTRPLPKCQLTLSPSLHFPIDRQRGNLIINQHLDPLVINSLHFIQFFLHHTPQSFKGINKERLILWFSNPSLELQKKQSGLSSLELQLGILLPYSLRFLEDPHTQGSLLGFQRKKTKGKAPYGSSSQLDHTKANIDLPSLRFATKNLLSHSLKSSKRNPPPLFF